jgi:arsenate reductase
VIYDFINTKLHPPSRDTLQGWVQRLGVKPLLNTSGQVYRGLPADKQTWTEVQWIEALAADAMLLKRPLFVRDGEAVMAGFPPQQPDLRARLGLEDDEG